MSGKWEQDPFERHQYRWFDGSRWTDRVADQGRISVDPVPSSPQRTARDDQSVGLIGGLAGVGAGYAVLVYLGIPSVVITIFVPPVGLIMCGLTIWLAVRAGRRVSRATHRGVVAASEHLARFFAEFRSYENKWGAWTPPNTDAPPRDGGGARGWSDTGRESRSNSGSSSFGGQPAPATPSAYEILGVAEGASPSEVRGAFHRLMLAVHPDRHMDKSPETRARMEDQAKVITEAYNAIKGR